MNQPPRISIWSLPANSLIWYYHLFAFLSLAGVLHMIWVARKPMEGPVLWVTLGTSFIQATASLAIASAGVAYTVVEGWNIMGASFAIRELEKRRRKQIEDEGYELALENFIKAHNIAQAQGESVKFLPRPEREPYKASLRDDLVLWAPILSIPIMLIVFLIALTFILMFD